jgi:Ser-tRNA(Ala) deacylase AlaX
MTPQDIFEYKLNWKPRAYTVRLHSDLHIEGKDWCRKNCERWEWSMNSYTNVYEHTFLFEKEQHGKEFEKQWPKFINQ